MRRSSSGISLAGEEDRWIIMPSGLAMPESVALKRKRPVAIDLFCGAGGFSLGTIQAGFQVIAGVDNDPASFHTYATNLCSYPLHVEFVTPEDEEMLKMYMQRIFKKKERAAKKRGEKIVQMGTAGTGWINAHNGEYPSVPYFFFGDVRQLGGERILKTTGMKRGEIDLVMGGPPCQGFSQSGKSQIMDPRNSLVFEFARLVIEISPKAMVFENVPGIASMVTTEGVPVIDAFCRILERGDYAPFEAMKRTLLNNEAAGAAYKGASVRIERQHQGEQSEQMSLFD